MGSDADADASPKEQDLPAGTSFSNKSIAVAEAIESNSAIVGQGNRVQCLSLPLLLDSNSALIIPPLSQDLLRIHQAAS